MEIFGHEFWAPDGKTIWYDLQTPRGEVFWLAGYNVETGARTWYHLERNEWSIHFNVTRDGKLFCGDGGDPGQVAHAPDGEWIYLFHAELVPNRGGSSRPDFVHARRLSRREAGEHVEAQVQPRTQRQLHARPEVGGLPLQHVRPHLRLRSRNRQSPMTPDYLNFINGKFTPSTGTGLVEVRNPSTGASICTVRDSTPEDVDAAVSAAEAAQKDWSRRPAVERGKLLRAIAAKIREHVEPLARIITEEQGKILDLARVEVAFTADYLDYMAEWARRIEGEILESDRPGETIFLFRQPIGVIGGILPWNFPFFLIARKSAPALVTGNTIVIKTRPAPTCCAGGAASEVARGVRQGHRDGGQHRRDRIPHAPPRPAGIVPVGTPGPGGA